MVHECIYFAYSFTILKEYAGKQMHTKAIDVYIGKENILNAPQRYNCTLVSSMRIIHTTKQRKYSYLVQHMDI